MRSRWWRGHRARRMQTASGKIRWRRSCWICGGSRTPGHWSISGTGSCRRSSLGKGTGWYFSCRNR